MDGDYDSGKEGYRLCIEKGVEEKPGHELGGGRDWDKAKIW